MKCPKCGNETNTIAGIGQYFCSSCHTRYTTYDAQINQMSARGKAKFFKDNAIGFAFFEEDALKDWLLTTVEVDSGGKLVKPK